MSKKPFVNQDFTGGQATSRKIGPENSFGYSQSIDFRSSPGQFTLLPRPYREDEGNVVDLIQNEVMVDDGTIYAIGDQGYFYRRTTLGVWSVVGTLAPGTFGLLYRKDQDMIYITSATTVSQYGPLSNNPVLQSNFYADSVSTYNNSDTMGFNVNANQETGTLTTAILTAAQQSSDDETQKRYFQTDITPVNKIGVKIAAKGAGNWTLTVYDGLDNVQGTATITNANLTAGQFNYFVFTDPMLLTVAPAAQTYYIRVTSTVADGTVYSTTANDLRTADLQVWADRLISTTNGMHPMGQIQQFVVICNGRYLSVWEPLGESSPSNASWKRQGLQFPPEWESCGIAFTSEYTAIACEQVASSDNVDPQDGIIFFWDGLQEGKYNFFIRIPEGSPYGIKEYKNVLYYEAGGSWYALQPFSDAQPEKIQLLPFGENSYNNNNNLTKVYPYASTTRNGTHLMAWPSTTTNANIPYGVYSFGRVDTDFPNSFGYSYLLSTASQFWSMTNNLTIGMIKNYGDTLHISWRDDDSENGAYGVDVVNVNSPLPNYATWESMIFDNGYVGKQKEADYIDASWLPLPDGVEVVLKYKLNRATDWLYSPRFSNTNTYEDFDNYARWYVGEQGQQARFNEAEIGIDIYAEDNVFESPTITSSALIFDDMQQEQLE